MKTNDIIKTIEIMNGLDKPRLRRIKIKETYFNKLLNDGIIREFNMTPTKLSIETGYFGVFGSIDVIIDNEMKKDIDYIYE